MADRERAVLYADSASPAWIVPTPSPAANRTLATLSPEMTPDDFDAGRFMAEILAMWTETNAEARRAAIESHFEEDARFFDADGEFAGLDGIEAFSDSLQSRFPGARFALARPPQMLGGSIRAFWQFGPAEKPRAVTGMDFVLLRGGRVHTLYAFLDREEN
jgi:SnoaL-like domain